MKCKYRNLYSSCQVLIIISFPLLLIQFLYNSLFAVLQGYKHRNAFIATQCPMENTVNDFWRMMWESQSAVIVMLCSEEHDPQVYCVFLFVNTL